jgi:hypothetical protein
MGAWSEVYPTYETIAVQVAAALLAVGSYAGGEHVRVRRPRRRSEPAAVRTDAPPAVT